VPATEAEMRAFSWASYSCFLRASSALTKLWGGKKEGGRGGGWLGEKRIAGEMTLIHGGPACVCVEVVGG